MGELSPVIVGWVMAACYLGLTIWAAKAVEERLFAPWAGANLLRQIFDGAMRVICVIFFVIACLAAWTTIVNVFKAIAHST